VQDREADSVFLLAGPIGGILSDVYEVDATKCIRCGVSANLAPMLFGIGENTAELIRQPRSADEILLAEQARIVCPVGAVSRVDVDRRSVEK
jgi:ferredoxin